MITISSSTTSHVSGVLLGLFLASSLALAGCPADDGTAETGGVGTLSTTDSATAGTAGTAAETADGSGTGGAAAVCEFGDGEWSFVDTLDMPEMRGVGTEDHTCNPVTEDTVALEVQLVLPGGIELDPSGAVRVLMFEADPFVADAGADCVAGLCESLDGSDLSWTFEVPNDQPTFTYYIVVDVDVNNPDVEGCTLGETDFVTFSPGQGTLMVPMTANGCV